MDPVKVMNEIKKARREVELELAIYPPNNKSDMPKELNHMLRKRIAERLPQLGKNWEKAAVKSATFNAALRHAELNTEVLRLAARLLTLQQRAYSAWSRGEIDEEDTRVTVVMRYDPAGQYNQLCTELGKLPVDAGQDWLNRQLNGFIVNSVLSNLALVMVRDEGDGMPTFHASLLLFLEDD
jgi:hypothetical protein